MVFPGLPRRLAISRDVLRAGADVPQDLMLMESWWVSVSSAIHRSPDSSWTRPKAPEYAHIPVPILNNSLSISHMMSETRLVSSWVRPTSLGRVVLEGCFDSTTLNEWVEGGV